ncbi:hypothetical protein A9978_25895 [Pseudomonas sp. UMC65]|uniref:hypothetical protein n=1 Tax=unclassified Pseudomonas TaxID=196821 RepID=UPI0015FF2B8C|nr:MULTISPECIES: hypothetical protein [unclassified Pseudomonas]MBB1615890.1 hypothetical protein [Pseudomonas sp. UMC65]
MLQSGYINFFSVNKCGLYRHFSESPNGLDLAETFTKLKSWKEDRNFEATNPWDASKKKNKTHCYCHAIHHDTSNGDFFLVLWKGDSDRHGPLYGITINPDGSIEQVVEQTKTKGNKQMIWGRPCYYWVIPELNIVASIKFDNSRTDSAMFQDWVSGCMNFRVPLPEYVATTTEKGFTRFEIADDKFKYYFQFDVSMKSLSTSSAEMQNLARKVTQIVRRETVSIKEVNKRKGFAKIFKNFEVPYISAEDNSIRQVELRVEAKPTVEELEHIIETYAADHDTKSWEDVGFVLDKSNSIVWASKYRLTDHISLDDNNQPIFNADEIYARVKENRDRYLGPIRKDMLKKQVTANG